MKRHEHSTGSLAVDIAALFSGERSEEAQAGAFAIAEALRIYKARNTKR